MQPYPALRHGAGGPAVARSSSNPCSPSNLFASYKITNKTVLKFKLKASGAGSFQRLYRADALRSDRQCRRRSRAKPLQVCAFLKRAPAVNIEQDLQYSFIVPKYETKFGQQLKIVGSVPELGAWDVTKARSLTWHAGHRWVLDVALPKESFDCKVILVDDKGKVVWETGPNRTVKCDWKRNEHIEAHPRVIVKCEWDKPAQMEMTLALPIKDLERAMNQARDHASVLRRQETSWLEQARRDSSPELRRAIAAISTRAHLAEIVASQLSALHAEALAKAPVEQDLHLQLDTVHIPTELLGLRRTDFSDNGQRPADLQWLSRDDLKFLALDTLERAQPLSERLGIPAVLPGHHQPSEYWRALVRDPAGGQRVEFDTASFAELFSLVEQAERVHRVLSHAEDGTGSEYLRDLELLSSFGRARLAEAGFLEYPPLPPPELYASEEAETVMEDRLAAAAASPMTTATASVLAVPHTAGQGAPGPISTIPLAGTIATPASGTDVLPFGVPVAQSTAAPTAGTAAPAVGTAAATPTVSMPTKPAGPVPSTAAGSTAPSQATIAGGTAAIPPELILSEIAADVTSASTAIPGAAGHVAALEGMVDSWQPPGSRPYQQSVTEALTEVQAVAEAVSLAVDEAVEGAIAEAASMGILPPEAIKDAIESIRDAELAVGVAPSAGRITAAPGAVPEGSTVAADVAGLASAAALAVAQAEAAAAAVSAAVATGLPAVGTAIASISRDAVVGSESTATTVAGSVGLPPIAVSNIVPAPISSRPVASEAPAIAPIVKDVFTAHPTRDPLAGHIATAATVARRPVDTEAPMIGPMVKDVFTAHPAVDPLAGHIATAATVLHRPVDTEAPAISSVVKDVFKGHGPATLPKHSDAVATARATAAVPSRPPSSEAPMIAPIAEDVFTPVVKSSKDRRRDKERRRSASQKASRPSTTQPTHGATAALDDMYTDHTDMSPTTSQLLTPAERDVPSGAATDAASDATVGGDVDAGRLSSLYSGFGAGTVDGAGGPVVESRPDIRRAADVFTPAETVQRGEPGEVVMDGKPWWAQLLGGLLGGGDKE